jgi:hypothetical protein
MVESLVCPTEKEMSAACVKKDCPRKKAASAAKQTCFFMRNILFLTDLLDFVSSDNLVEIASAGIVQA